MNFDADQVIIHIDLDAFFCSVEVLLNPHLKLNKQPIVISEHPKYGIVAASNYKSRILGIKSGMPIFKAVKIAKKNNDVILILQPNYEKYYEYHHALIMLIKTFGRNIEIGSIDEVYLDITTQWASFGSIINYCTVIQNCIFTKLGLKCKIGVSFTKYLAKLATNAIKRYANDHQKIKIISHNSHLAFLKDLKTSEIHYVGPRTDATLTALGIDNAYELIHYNQPAIIDKLLGKRYELLVANLIGLTQTKIDKNRGCDFQSISISKTMNIRISDRTAINDKIEQLFQHLFKKLIIVQNVTKLVSIRFKYTSAVNNWKTYQKSLPVSTNLASILKSAISELVAKRLNAPIIGIGLTFAKLADVKQKYEFLKYYLPSESDKEIYKIITSVNNELDISLVTTLLAFKKKNNLFKEKFIFRRTL